MTLSQTIRELKSHLAPIYGEGEATAMIRLMFHHLKGWTASDLIIHSESEVSPHIEAELKKIVGRLEKHEPIQYILGEAYFFGMNLKVTPAVLIPRQETEQLVDMIVSENKEDDLRVLDLCAGSGAIAIALARNLRFPQVSGIDISAQALEVAEENNRTLKADVKFAEADIFRWEPTAGTFDIIVSNPPYVGESEKEDMDANVLDYEPESALFVPDENPLVFYKRIGEIALRGLATGGRLYLEANHLHCDSLREMLEGQGLHHVEIVNDSFGKPRFVKAVK